MHIAYVNANYQQNHAGGGHVHMEQFIANAIALGHEVWTYPGNQYPGVHHIPTNRIKHIRTMRKMDALYVRLEQAFPQVCTWALPPRRWLYGFPIVVWEFNTIPDDASFLGKSEDWVIRTVDRYQKYGKGCDLAICVASAAEEYVKSKLRIRNTIMISNGSDPALFSPDCNRVPRMESFRDSINVVWVGSAKIKYHDFDVIKEAAKIIWTKREPIPINFHILGPDFRDRMADMPPNVYYWGAEDYHRLPNWLSAMDIGLYISKGGSSSYGSPLKVFDYMSSGLAVISTTHPAIEEIFHQLNQSDLMVEPGNGAALAATIITLAKDPERIKILGQRGRSLVINQYNWSQSIRTTMEAMERIL